MTDKIHTFLASCREKREALPIAKLECRANLLCFGMSSLTWEQKENIAAVACPLTGAGKRLEDALDEALRALEEIYEIDEHSFPGKYAGSALARIEAILTTLDNNGGK